MNRGRIAFLSIFSCYLSFLLVILQSKNKMNYPFTTNYFINQIITKQKMKKIFSYFMIFMCLLGTSVVTSCSSDDDNEEDKLADLPYENEAAIYQVTDTESRISYIELTSNGNYIIEYKSMVVGSSAYNVKDNFEYGTFKKSTKIKRWKFSSSFG